MQIDEFARFCALHPVYTMPVEFENFDVAGRVEGHFTHSKKRTRFFQNKRIYTDFDGFFSKTKGFLPKVYEIFGSEMPLG